MRKTGAMTAGRQDQALADRCGPAKTAPTRRFDGSLALAQTPCGTGNWPSSAKLARRLLWSGRMIRAQQAPTRSPLKGVCAAAASPDGRLLASLERGAVFGEAALLDHAWPRLSFTTSALPADFTAMQKDAKSVGLLPEEADLGKLFAKP